MTKQQFYILHFLTIVKLDLSGHCLLPGAHCHVFLVCNEQLTPLTFCGACVWIGQCAQSWLFLIRKGRQKIDIFLPRSIFADNWTKKCFLVKFFSWFWKFVMSSKDEGAFISLYFHLCEAVCSSYKGVEDATHILFWETTMGCLIVGCHNIPLLIVVTSHAATFISHALQQQWTRSPTWQRWQKLLHNLV